jgi:sulfatase modifying factor 1
VARGRTLSLRRAAIAVLAFAAVVVAPGCGPSRTTPSVRPPAVPSGYRLPKGWSAETRVVTAAIDGALVKKQVTCYVSPSLSIPFVYVPAGRFAMGSPPDEPGRPPDEVRHTVRLSEPFLISAHEITAAQYWALFPAEARMTDETGALTSPDAPITDVSWRVAIRFAQKLSGKLGPKLDCRLPTEAEWEYACRAGSTGAYSWGDVSKGAWLNCADSPAADRREAPADVGSYPANAWGLYEMHGNVAEWCRDWYTDRLPSDRTRLDPRGPISGTQRVVRGGSYEDRAERCRSAARRGLEPDRRNRAIGFRVVIHLPDERDLEEMDTILPPFHGLLEN